MAITLATFPWAATMTMRSHVLLCPIYPQDNSGEIDRCFIGADCGGSEGLVHGSAFDLFDLLSFFGVGLLGPLRTASQNLIFRSSWSIEDRSLYYDPLLLALPQMDYTSLLAFNLKGLKVPWVHRRMRKFSNMPMQVSHLQDQSQMHTLLFSPLKLTTNPE